MTRVAFVGMTHLGLVSATGVCSVGFDMLCVDEDGALIERWGTFNSVWRQNAEGDWHVVFDAGNVADKPPPAEVRALLDKEDAC